jgi:deoxynucleoside triphosphate triphosphohydrolase SAMHD1
MNNTETGSDDTTLKSKLSSLEIESKSDPSSEHSSKISSEQSSKSSLEPSLDLTLNTLPITADRYQINSRSELLRIAKEINIPVYGTIPLTLLAIYFIDNKYFQRLDKLKQLGTCDMIFPGAKHTRFEHSIGTYYLANQLMTRIKDTSDQCKMTEWLGKIPELTSHFKMKKYKNSGLNKWIIELIKIAALCHDLGHGPYSHMFDDIFIKKCHLRDHPLATHEKRSCVLVEKIVEESETLSKFVTKSDIQFIQSLIDVDYKKRGFVYHVVSNPMNSLDVDKFDYLGRDSHHTGVKIGFDYTKLVNSVLVIDDMIVYPEQADQDIYQLFIARHSMHRKMYGHKGVISAQYIITEIMQIVDKVIHISESILDLDKFVKMTDNYIIDYMEFILEMRENKNNPFKNVLIGNDYDKLIELKRRLQTHDLYPHIGTVITKTKLELDNDDHKINVFNDDNHMIHRSVVGFVSGDKSNPLDEIYVYKTKEQFIHKHNAVAHRINRTEISFITSDIYQEHVTMIFRKDRDSVGILQDKKTFQKIKDHFR